MNKAVATLGVFAVSMSGVYAQAADKPWSIGATVRGFYDDNPLTRPDGVAEESFGIQGGPNIGYTIDANGTKFAATYEYRYRYFEADFMRDDQIHRIDVSLERQVNENLNVYVSDQFVSTREPTIIEPSGAVTTLLRTESDVIRNYATAGFVRQLNDTTSIGVEYNNRYYDYDDPGFSRILDRVEHAVTVDGRKVLREDQGLAVTTGIVGYQFEDVGFSDDSAIAPGVTPDIRDRRSHFLFVGADHLFSERLQGSIRVGVQMTDYHNTPNDQDVTNPYVDAKMAYQVDESGVLAVGVRHNRASTDISAFAPGVTPGGVTLDQEVTTVYGQYSRDLVPEKLTLRVSGQAQLASFNGGAFDNTDETLILVGGSLDYKFNENLTGEFGYRYQDLSNDGPLAPIREFDRNYVYIGLTASY